MVFLGKKPSTTTALHWAVCWLDLLDLPFVSYASKLDMAGNTATIEREIEGGKEVLTVDVPFVIISSKRNGRSSYSENMKGIMSAKTKPLNVVAHKERRH